MRRNVDAADKAVNDNNAGSVYSGRYASGVSSTAARPYHHGNLRETLLVAGGRALETGGAQNLSLRELAREAGVSHAAPRRHFAGKQALLDALALDGWERLGATLAAAVADAGTTFDARLLGLAHAYVTFANDRPALVALMFATKHQPGSSPALAEAGDRAFAPALTAVADGQSAGEVATGDPKRVALVAFAALQGLVALANNGMLDDDGPLEDLLDDAVTRLILGLRPRAES
jgi:AcrR family transcriptional regulator